MTGRGVPASSTIVSLNEQEVLSEEETKKTNSINYFFYLNILLT